MPTDTSVGRQFADLATQQVVVCEASMTSMPPTVWLSSHTAVPTCLPPPHTFCVLATLLWTSTNLIATHVYTSHRLRLHLSNWGLLKDRQRDTSALAACPFKLSQIQCLPITIEGDMAAFGFRLTPDSSTGVLDCHLCGTSLW